MMDGEKLLNLLWIILMIGFVVLVGFGISRINY